jgi:uncharacterized membrane protein YedE/YeeE
MQFGIISFLIGMLFSLGLGLSGMTDPQRVLGFLDFFGRWDPSLIFVMASAIPVYFLFWQSIRGKRRALWDPKLHVPTRRDIDKNLLVGSTIFGIGWGLVGICPGPGFAGVGAMSLTALVFIVCYFLGAYLEGLLGGN